MILYCGCKSSKFGVTQAALQQDEWYGIGNRVHNDTVKEDMYRCTVCGVERGQTTKAAAAAKKSKKTA